MKPFMAGVTTTTPTTSSTWSNLQGALPHNLSLTSRVFYKDLPNKYPALRHFFHRTTWTSFWPTFWTTSPLDHCPIDVNTNTSTFDIFSLHHQLPHHWLCPHHMDNLHFRFHRNNFFRASWLQHLQPRHSLYRHSLPLSHTSNRPLHFLNTYTSTGCSTYTPVNFTESNTPPNCDCCQSCSKTTRQTPSSPSTFGRTTTSRSWTRTLGTPTDFDKLDSQAKELTDTILKIQQQQQRLLESATPQTNFTWSYSTGIYTCVLPHHNSSTDPNYGPSSSSYISTTPTTTILLRPSSPIEISPKVSFIRNRDARPRHIVADLQLVPLPDLVRHAGLPLIICSFSPKPIWDPCMTLDVLLCWHLLQHLHDIIRSGTTVMTPGAIGENLPRLLTLLHLPSHRAPCSGPPPGAVSNRVPDGDTDNSEDDDQTVPISAFERSDEWLTEFKDAEQDPLRTRCMTELPSDHIVELKETFTPSENALFKSIIDEMYTQLAKPYTTQSGTTVFIRANRSTVENIAKCFARSDLLDVTLTQGTRGFYIEPENLLSITVPTGLPPKDPFKGESSGSYACYHRTDWSNVPKILKENCIRPASWSKNENNVPNQFPCCVFFGYSCEIADAQNLDHCPKDQVRQLPA